MNIEKGIVTLKLYVTMKRFLTLKPSHTRSQTESSTKNQDCSETTANLSPVKTEEPVTEAVSHIA